MGRSSSFICHEPRLRVTGGSGVVVGVGDDAMGDAAAAADDEVLESRDGTREDTVIIEVVVVVVERENVASSARGVEVMLAAGTVLGNLVAIVESRGGEGVVGEAWLTFAVVVVLLLAPP